MTGTLRGPFPKISPPRRRTRRSRTVVGSRPTVSTARAAAVAGVLVTVAGTFMYRLADLQLSPDPRLQSITTPLAEDPIAAPRGEIVDRVGRALALSLPTPTVIADPRFFAADDVAGAVAQLAPLLSASPERLTERLSSDRAFAYLERQVDPEVGEAVAALGIPGIWLVDEPRRENPNGTCSGLGVIGRVDTEHVGISGLEKVRDEELRGVPGELNYEASADGSFKIPGGRREVVVPASPGAELELTLDRNVQYRAEQLLVDAVERARGAQGSVIVSIPGTGEVVAMANVERDTETGIVNCTRTNHAVTWSFEPGSIMKPLTVAAVVEAGVHGARQEIVVPGSILRADDDDGKTFEDYWPHDDILMTPEDIITDSSNVGTILLAEKLGPDGLHEELVEFGLGAPTSLGLPGEASGILDPLDTNTLALATAAIGQSVSVTPMQMHQAFGTLANDGVHVEPAVIATDIDMSPGTRVVSSATSTAVMEMMTGVVERGTGTAARVPGYSVAGKTGTAWQVCADTGGYWCADGQRHYTASFVGIVSNDLGPVLSITLVIDDAKEPYYSGGTASAPMFAEIAAYAVRQLGIAPVTANGLPTDRVRAEVALAPSEDPEAES